MPKVNLLIAIVLGAVVVELCAGCGVKYNPDLSKPKSPKYSYSIWVIKDFNEAGSSAKPSNK